jgi:hypothetical protein
MRPTPCDIASTRRLAYQGALAISRRPVALHIRNACDIASTRRLAYQERLRYRVDPSPCISGTLAISRRPDALHIRNACDIASTRRLAYQGRLILRVPVLGNDSYMCLFRTWVGMNLARGSPHQGDLCPCHDRSSCPDGAEMELRTLPRRRRIVWTRRWASRSGQGEVDSEREECDEPSEEDDEGGG